MRRFFLLGLTALGLIALAPAESKADEGFRIYIGPSYPQYGPYYYREDYPRYRYYRHPDEYRWHRCIIGTTTIGITIRIDEIRAPFFSPITTSKGVIVEKTA